MELQQAKGVGEEVTALQEAMKNTVFVAELASKLEQRDAAHEQNRRKLRAAVRRLTDEIKETEAKHQAYMKEEKKKYQDLVVVADKMREGLDRQVLALGERERRVLKIMRQLDRRLSAGIYPESQGAEQDAVDIFHAKQLEQGMDVRPDTPWAMEDYAIACHARLKPIDDLMLRLFDAVGKVFEAL